VLVKFSEGEADDVGLSEGVNGGEGDGLGIDECEAEPAKPVKERLVLRKR
jgi:hypothetical protein